MNYLQTVKNQIRSGISQILRKTITSLLTISFEKTNIVYKYINSLILLPLEDEHIRRVVHTTVTQDPNQERGDDKGEFYNKSWLRSTDFKRELKLKLQKQMGITEPAPEPEKSRSRTPVVKH
jgi:hypothetical protein